MQSHLKYRADIDGLRGIAVLSVLAFHGFPKLLPGGFMGVDIFFVISGYLITKILLNNIYENNFFISEFYARRIKRIFPALIVVLAVTIILGWLLLFPTEFRNLGRQVVGAAIFSSNFLLWRETGYFNNDAQLKPLLNLWSLGVEEQFYIIFPIMLWLANRQGIAKPNFLLLLLLMSFGLSLFGTSVRPIATFFLPVTRFWELLVGCTLAAPEVGNKGFPKISLDSQFSESVSILCQRKRIFDTSCTVLGLALILIGVAYFSNEDAFPGWWALLPTIGTGLVILAGPYSSINRWILGNKLLVGVGLVSYPLYLWHWPLLYFGRIIYPDGMPNIAILMILGASGVLATLTYLYIEIPVRFWSLFKTNKTLFLCSAMLLLMVFGFLAMRGILPSRWGLSRIGNEIENAESDGFYPFPDNWRRTREFKIDTKIVQGKPEGAILFIGDSHLQNYWPRIEFVLKSLKENARPVIFLTAGGTPTLPNVNKTESGFAFNKFFDFALNEATNNNISTIVFCCFWEAYFIGVFPSDMTYDIYRVGDKERIPLRLGSTATKQVFEEFGRDISKLTKLGKEVVVILPAPTCTLWSPKKFPRIFSELQLTNQLPVARKDFESFIHPVKSELIDVVVRNGGKIIDPLDYFEEDGFLNGKTVDGRFRYVDTNHMRPFYVIEKATFLDSLLRVKGHSSEKH